MAKTHGVVNTTHCACWDVDAYNFAGVAQVDLDNGTFVALGDLQKTGNAIDEYTFDLTVDANGTASGYKYIVDSPVRGIDIETQLMDDPRYFYIPAGKTASVKRIVGGDCIEIDINAFEVGATPVDQATYTLASIGANGKLQMVQTSGDFKLLGTVERGIGQEVVTNYVFMYTA